MCIKFLLSQRFDLISGNTNQIHKRNIGKKVKLKTIETESSFYLITYKIPVNTRKYNVFIFSGSETNALMQWQKLRPVRRCVADNSNGRCPTSQVKTVRLDHVFVETNKHLVMRAHRMPDGRQHQMLITIQ